MILAGLMGSLAASGGANYTLTPAANNVNEGSALTFTVGGTNITNGTYYWTVQTNSGDFSTSSGEVGIVNNDGSFTVTPTADATTEDPAVDTFTVALRSVSTSGTILVTSTAVTINDTSQTPTPTYSLAPGGANNVNEGSAQTFYVGGTAVPAGTYYWTIETNAGDFATTNGTVSVSAGTGLTLGSFTVTPTEDATTEGTEQFTVALRSVSITGDILASSGADINDTSLDPVPTYTLTPDADNVNEGSSLEFTVGGTNITNGTYYWTIETDSDDFATISGTVSVTDNSGTFSVTPTADDSTEGPETFTVTLRSVSITGTILQTSESITINDTSLTPVPPFSMAFTGTRRLAVQYFQSDWNLGTTWTMEWWSKTTTPTTGLRTVMSQAPLETSIDVYYESGNLFMSNGTNLGSEPPVGGVPNSVTAITDSTGSWEANYGSNITTTGGTGTGLTVDVAAAGSGYAGTVAINTPGSGYTTGDTITAVNGSVNGGSSVTFTITATARGIWTHVALSSDEGLVKVYYNGVQKSSVQRNLSLTDANRDLYIGRRGNNDFQYFDGNLALIRISEVARYATAFSPSVSYGVDADTLLFLGLNNPLVDLSTYELNGVTTSANGGTTIYFAKSVYPDLDKQIQAGNTVVGGTPTTTATVTGAVFTPGGDPDNWGVLISTTMSALATVNFSGVRHTVTNTGVVRTNDVPSFQSLVFNNSQQDFLRVPASSDFNLGTTWTIEFWLSANGSGISSNPAMGNAGLWGLLNQGGWTSANQITVAISDAKLCIGGKDNGDDVRFAEPAPNGQASGVSAIVSDTQWWDYNYGTGLVTTGGTGAGLTVNVGDAGNGYASIVINNPGGGYTNGDTITVTNGPFNDAPIVSTATFTIAVANPVVWTHVAVVNDEGTPKVYYNGVEQSIVSGTFDSLNYTSSSESLYIGRLAPQYGGHFDGKMTMVRISNSAKYLAPFIPTTTYNVDANTKLFLSKVNPLGDSSASDHAVTNNGVTTSTDVPVIVPATITITNVSVGFNSRVATVDFTANVTQSETATIFFEWGGGGSYSGPHTLTVNPGVNTYTSPMLGLSGSGSDLTTEITIASGLNGCTSNIYTGAWSVICLVEGTMVTMADGSYKAIEDVRYNDLIRVWNFDLGEFSEALPVFVKQEETHSEHYQFTFSDGTVLRTVGHHVFNKQAGAFTMLVRDTTPVGTITFNELGEEVTLISKETIQEPVKFYNVWTQYHLNLFAQGILTSNRFNNIYPIQDMKFVKDNRALRPLEEFANIDPTYISGLRLQEQPKQYSAEYIKDYIENKLERLDIANVTILTP